MCTAATYKTKDFYFGRTLDYEMSYGEEVVITPRNYVFKFRTGRVSECHYAIIGMAHVAGDYPLYYDAMNEKGLCMAGLNFVGNAKYNDILPDMENICQFEFIPWVLSSCSTVAEARELLKHTNLTDIPFSDMLPPAELHWIIGDSTDCITVETAPFEAYCDKTGESKVVYRLKIYDNPIGVLTNNPRFDMQMFNLNNYINVSAKEPVNRFSDKAELAKYGRGMGAIGLPGDLSSESRFVRAAFTKLNSVSGDSEAESVSQFFHILGSVCQQKGCCDLGQGKYEYTIYTSCMNADKGIYYYTTYGNQRITGININNENINDTRLIKYPLYTEQDVLEVN